MGLGCSHVRDADLALTSFCLEGGTVAPEGQQGKGVLVTFVLPTGSIRAL